MQKFIMCVWSRIRCVGGVECKERSSLLFSAFNSAMLMFCSGIIIDTQNFSYPLCTGGGGDGQVCDLFKSGHGE